MFLVNEFRWLSTTDAILRDFGNWSRTYEYPWILNKIKSLELNNPSIHNTCCGTADIHLFFAKKLNDLSSNIIHSDVATSKLWESENINIEYYNLQNIYNKKFDIVVCISTLEDTASSKDNLKVCFDNLINQVVSDGKLLITCDYPSVPLEWIEELIGQKITPNNTETKLTSANSVFPAPGFIIGSEYYKIIVIELTKI